MRYKGVVQQGKKRGRELGFPTINITMKEAPVSGIFAATVRIGPKNYQAAAFADMSRNVLEAYILDFSDDVYGEEVVIELLQKIREDEVYTDDVELQRAIAGDVAKVRGYFTT